jgi:hypothetical protein
MEGCLVEPINSTNESENVFKVPYLPFCISTLKLKLTNLMDETIAVSLIPIKSVRTDELCVGYDDNKKGIHLIWGGGEEDGPRVNINRGEKKYVFFFVHHKQNFLSDICKLDIEEYRTTIKITTRVGRMENPDYDKHDFLNISFYPVRCENDLIREQTRDSSDKSELISFQGSLIPCYYPRWFPELFFKTCDEKTSNFYKNANLPDVELCIERKDKGFPNDSVIVRSISDQKTLALISGDLDGAKFCADIFYFYDSYILRLWFFWISKKQYFDRIGLETGEIDRGFSNPELPDIERYDFLFNDNKIMCIGTDFHWQEYWHRPKKNAAIRGTIRKYWHPPQKTALMFLTRFSPTIYTGIIENLKKFTDQANNKVKPGTSESELESEINNKNAEMAKDANRDTDRWKNLLRSHVPFLNNSLIVRDMVSKRVDTL